MSVSGEVLLRTGVTLTCPEGLAWSMVTTDCTVAAICVDMGPCLSYAPDPDASVSSPSSLERRSSTAEVKVSCANGGAGGRMQLFSVDHGPSNCQVIRAQLNYVWTPFDRNFTVIH